MRFSKILSTCFFILSLHVPSVISVVVKPGATALTYILGANSLANPVVKFITAAFDEAYATLPTEE